MVFLSGLIPNTHSLLKFYSVFVIGGISASIDFRGRLWSENGKYRLNRSLLRRALHLNSLQVRIFATTQSVSMRDMQVPRSIRRRDWAALQAELKILNI